MMFGGRYKGVAERRRGCSGRHEDDGDDRECEPCGVRRGQRRVEVEHADDRGDHEVQRDDGGDNGHVPARQRRVEADGPGGQTDARDRREREVHARARHRLARPERVPARDRDARDVRDEHRVHGRHAARRHASRHCPRAVQHQRHDRD